MPANEQTPGNPHCSCGAIEFGPDVPHKTECYIMLAKDADATEGVPVRDLSTSGRKRTQVPLPPADEMEYSHLEWVEGLDPNIVQVQSDGSPALIKTGSIIGKLDNRRSVEGQNGLMYFGDLTIEAPGTEIHDIGISFSMPIILRKLLEHVALGTSVEIIRKGKIGKAFGFEVYVLD